MVFGGPQSANDDHLPGIRAELDWLERTALPSDRPLLGICLGAQMIARVLGAKVGPHPDGLVEIGYHTIHPTAAGQAYLEGPTLFYQWHRETFEIPCGAVHLAHNEAFNGQAFRYNGHVYGLEFHPEMTRAMIERWTTLGARQRDAVAARRPGPRAAARRATTGMRRSPIAGWTGSCGRACCARQRRRAAG